MTVPLPAELVARYLAVLGLTLREPGRAALDELVAAHVSRVPFENLSKLYRMKRFGLTGLPPLPLFLEDVERHRLGGTCYSNNVWFWALLVSLGFEARLCGADMSEPDVHAVIVVRVDGREVLVDAGYGAPFLSPLPLDLSEEHRVEWGHESYVLRPRDAVGRSRLELRREGVVKHGYLAKPDPRAPGDFARAIADSFRPDATFMNAVAVYRFEHGALLALRNLTLIEGTPTTARTRRLSGRGELVAVVEERFGIPGGVVAEAVSELAALRDVWG
jgi:N-hydroxyarylamine O-acetyltransferase